MYMIADIGPSANGLIVLLYLQLCRCKQAHLRYGLMGRYRRRLWAIPSLPHKLMLSVSLHFSRRTNPRLHYSLSPLSVIKIPNTSPTACFRPKSVAAAVTCPATSVVTTTAAVLPRPAVCSANPATPSPSRLDVTQYIEDLPGQRPTRILVDVGLAVVPKWI